MNVYVDRGGKSIQTVSECGGAPLRPSPKEAHAAGADLTTLLPNVQVPFGLRTVDGTFNHLGLGQSEFGSADMVFPRLTDPIFRNDLDVDTFDAHGPAPGGVVTNTNYAGPGDVANTDPRIIRNLIVDQLPFNPATGEGNPAAAAAEATPLGSEVVLSPSLDDDFRITSNNTILIGVNAAAINATDFILAPRGGHHSKANAQYHGTGRLD